MPNLFIVTPGYAFGPNEPVTIAKLNALGQPVVSPGPDITGLYATLKNILINGNLLIWQRVVNVGNSVAAVAATKTFLADRWFLRPTGGNPAYGQDVLVPAGALATKSIKITGAAGVTSVELAQRIEASDAANCCRQILTFQAKVFNGTGAAFVPALRLATPNAADDYTGFANGIVPSPALQVCQPGMWTLVSYTFDPSAFANISNGLELNLSFPAGTLDNAAKNVNVTELQLERGAAATAIEGRITTFEYDLCQRYCLALHNTILGFSVDATNVGNKGLFTLPTTMRIKPVFEGAASFTDLVYAPMAGTPQISGYANNIIMAVANVANNFAVGVEVNLIATFSAEDTSGT